MYPVRVIKLIWLSWLTAMQRVKRHKNLASSSMVRLVGCTITSGNNSLQTADLSVPSNWVLKPGKDDNGTSQHECKVLVKENGYSRLDAETYDAVVKLVGKEWAENHITESIVATIDFSLCTKDKETKVFEVLNKLNEFVGDGFVNWEVGYQPNSRYHPARHSLTSEVDEELETLTPTVCSFGR